MINSHKSVVVRQPHFFTASMMEEHFMVISKDTIIVLVGH